MKKFLIITVFLFLGFFIFSNPVEKGFIYKNGNIFIKSFPILEIHKFETYNSEVPIYPTEKKEEEKTPKFECVLSSSILFSTLSSKRLKPNKERIKKNRI